MTDEERAEAERLLNEIDHLKARIERALVEQEQLKIELEELVKNINVVTGNAQNMDSEVNKVMAALSKKIKVAETDTSDLFELIQDLTSSYFVFKNLSEASKNVTQYTDEYFTKFRFFNELRRITLGYVIGLDAHVCSDITMRKKVERVYLQNTDYWLAYAIMAVMLWASNEEEAAKRALSKSLSMGYKESTLFFLLINLRFTRVDAAKKWYLSYLDRTNLDDLGNEWQYLLQTYLAGVFGVDKEFNSLVHQYLKNLLEQMETMHPNYGNVVIEKTLNYSRTFIHITENEFETLRRNCKDYGELKSLLSAAEKNTVLAVNFKKIFESESGLETNIFERIEDILYNLINAYDKEENKVIKNKKYNEMIIKAKGDLGLAQKFFDTEYGDESKKQTLDELLYKWAFSEDISQVDITVKRFSLSYLKKWIAKGFSAYAEDYRKRECEEYTFSIDGWVRRCNEDSYNEAKKDLEKYYNANRFLNMMKDKLFIVFIGMALASIITLVITFFQFNKIALVIGILLGVVAGFLIWRRTVDLLAILNEKRKNGCLVLKNALDELKAWRKMYKAEDVKNSDLVNVFDNIEI